MIFVRLDENVSYRLGEFAAAIGVPQNVQFDAPHLRGETGATDPDWMTAHSARGKPSDLKLAFSADDFTDAERALAEFLKITLFSTPKMYWRPLKRLGQTAYFLRWLPRMLELAALHPSGSQFRLPRNFGSGPGLVPMKSILSRKTIRSGRPRKPKTPIPLPLLEGVPATPNDEGKV